MNKVAIEQVAFHDRMAVQMSPGAGLGKFTAAVAMLCANKLRRHLGASERLGAVRKDFEHSVPPESWAGSDSVMLAGFADSVSDDEVGVTLEVRAEATAREPQAQVLARAKLVFSVSKHGPDERRQDHELRDLVSQGALNVTSLDAVKGMRTMRAHTATHAMSATLGAVTLLA